MTLPKISDAGPLDGSEAMVITQGDKLRRLLLSVLQVVGPAGPKGDPGRGISSAVLTSGNLVVTYTDGTTAALGNVIGPSGAAGVAGSQIRTGTGTPTATATVGDLYLDTVTGDLWRMN